MTPLRFENAVLAGMFGPDPDDDVDEAGAGPAPSAAAGPATSVAVARPGVAEASPAATGTMTVAGTVDKAAILLAVLVAAAAVGWRVSDAAPGAGWALVTGGAIGAAVLAIVTAGAPGKARLTAPAYAALEGLSLGAISFAAEASLPGVVIQATVATLAVLGAMLVAYSLGLIRATAAFTRGVVTATGAIAMTYLVALALGAVGVRVPFLHSGTGVGALVSLAIIGVVTLNLILDFAFIEQAAAEGAERQLEWYGAFGLVVTLVWLYVEILLFLLERAGELDIDFDD